MVMEKTYERKMCCKEGVAYFTDHPLGLYVVRGDSMVLLGQIGKDFPAGRMKEVTQKELDELIKDSGSGGLQWDFDNDLTA
mmetsp:Transcript_18065/g.30799  ORF Transcript_18065/g.30799 Transcript_18065/m.30799 type:complete len:81 (+) Transcript_18065:348-590(+)